MRSQSVVSTSSTGGGGVACPHGVPHLLWETLERQYNTSQLRALHAVCATSVGAYLALAEQGAFTMKAGAEGLTELAERFSPFAFPPLTLVQGPPGTGKVL